MKDGTLRGRFIGWVIGKLGRAEGRALDLQVMSGTLGAAPHVMIGLVREAPTKLRDERAAIALPPLAAIDLGGELIAAAGPQLGLHVPSTAPRNPQEAVQAQRALIVAVTLARALFAAKVDWQEAEARVEAAIVGLDEAGDHVALAERAVEFAYGRPR